MSKVAEKTDPKLWERVKKTVTAEDKGGKPGQWSARKAQRAVQIYEEKGGGFKGRKTADNHLTQWQDEDWGTKSGKESLETGERYLPKKARDALTADEYKQTTKKKRADLKKGRQFSAQPEKVASKAAKYRATGRAKTADRAGETKAELMQRARDRQIPGRSTMSKAQLERALR